jgi:hypothetical protein
MKHVYVIEIGGLSRIDNQFHFYDMEIFPSEKAALANIKNMVEVNTNTPFDDAEVEVEEMSISFRRGEKKCTFFTYNCMSSPDFETGERKEMRVRYVLRKMEVNRNM